MEKNQELNNEYTQYDCLIFDCDGTLANTMSAHFAAYQHAFKYYHISFTKKEFFEYGPKGGNILLNELIIKKGYDPSFVDKIKNMKSDCIEQFLDTHMHPNDELINLIKEYHTKCKLAVVSSGRHKSICTILEKLGILKYFDLVITADDCKILKPHPQPYIMAYTQLNVDPKKCLVFEDNDIGVESATKAGLTVKLISGYN